VRRCVRGSAGSFGTDVPPLPAPDRPTRREGDAQVVLDQTHTPDDLQDAPSADRAGSGSGLSPRAFAGALGGVLLVQLAASLYLLRGSYFFAEDFYFLQTYADRPVSAELLRTSIFGHLIPGYILLQKCFGSWFGADWGLASLVTLGVQLGGTIAFARLLLALVGRRTWWTVWLTAAFGLSVVVLNTAPWWAATSTMQITMVAAISAWGCTLRYAATGAWRHLLSLAVMYTVSVAFFEKSIATSLYLGLFVLLVGTQGDEPFRARRRRALRLWPAWTIIAVVTLADLAVYVTGPYLDEAGPAAALGVQAEYLARSLPEGAFPTLIGSVYPESTIPGPHLLTVVVATAVCLGVVAWTSLRSRLAVRVWVWYFVVILFSQALVARGRLGLIDVDTVVHNLRYQGDAVYLFLIGLAVALPAAVRASGGSTRRRASIAAVAAPLLALPLWVQSVHSISADTPGRVSRDYFAALRSGDLPEDTRFLDLPAPGWIVPPAMYPGNMARVIYPVVRPGVRITDDPDGASWVRPDGSVGPLVLSDLTPPTTAPTCVPRGAAVEILKPPTDQLDQYPPPVLLALHYTVEGDRAQSVQLYVGRNLVRKNIRSQGPAFELGSEGDLATVIAPTHWNTVYLDVKNAGEVCVTDVRLARPGG
jgi:hypothetical protein